MMVSSIIIEQIMTHDDILILGDSFASSRGEATDWPVLVVNRLTGSTIEPRGEGYPGASWWSVRVRLLKELKIKMPQLLILCHTELSRLPSDYDLPLNVGLKHGHQCNPRPSNRGNDPDIKVQMFPEIVKAAEGYYKYLSCIDHALWAQRQWFQEIDSIVKDIPMVIHLHCFPQYYTDQESYVFQHGITSKEDLYTLQMSLPPTTEREGRNHFSNANNVKIGNALLNVITNFSPRQNGTMIDMNLLNK
jgi:hypothetical protein